ncbi:phosphatidate cytidylyltransferase [bacterium]|nr:phosphatidate cytidylyltransferase [bacterium]
MKQRVISAIVALLILVPIFIIGGFVYDAAIIILSLLALREFLKVKETKKELPSFIHFISYIIMTLLVMSGVGTNTIVFSIDFRVITGLFMVFLLPAILYHDRSLYSINDAFYLIGGIFFLGISFSLFIIFRNISLNTIIYLFLISTMTDTYAYIIGRLIGKNKLLETISPNKTWEGMIAGTLFGTLIASAFYFTLNPSISVFKIVIITCFLSILGQFGDLVFSSIKRYFGKKDFSNIMPGHGGILDRFDSIIFIMLGYVYFITIL